MNRKAQVVPRLTPIDELPRSGVRRWIGVGLPFLLLMFALITVPIRLLGSEGFTRYHALRQELKSIQAYNAVLRHQTRRLIYQVDQLKNDVDALEHIARDELGWIGANDVLIHFNER